MAQVDLKDIKFKDALDHARQLVRVLESAGFTAPELMQGRLNAAANEVSAIATALKLGGR